MKFRVIKVIETIVVERTILQLCDHLDAPIESKIVQEKQTSIECDLLEKIPLEDYVEKAPDDVVKLNIAAKTFFDKFEKDDVIISKLHYAYYGCSANSKRQLKYVGLDNFNRPVFKDKSAHFYGSVDVLFSSETSPEKIINALSPHNICYFGKNLIVNPREFH